MTRQEYNREASSHATCNWVEIRNQAAIAAMQGLISNRVYADYMTRKSKEDGFKFSDAVVEDAIEMADALVEQLKKEGMVC